MRLLLKLALSNHFVRLTRTMLTTCAIALSVSLVVAVTSGYATVESAVVKSMRQFLGNTDAKIVRMNDSYAGVPGSLIEQVAADPDVESAVGRIETYALMMEQSGRPIDLRSAFVVGIQRPQDKRVEAMEMKEGAWFDTSDGDVVVLDQVASMMLADMTNVYGDEKRPKVKVGDTITLPSPLGNLRLRVVGIVHKPKILAILQPSMYVPFRTLQKWLEETGGTQAQSGGSVPGAIATTSAATQPTTQPAFLRGRVSNISIDLKPEATPTKFAARWRARLTEIDPTLWLRLEAEQRSEIDSNMFGLRIASYFGGAISLLAAAFIILSALSMGVIERQRSLAMLRAIGAAKTQLAGLVVLEALLLAVIGVIVGVPLGLLWLKILYWSFYDLLQDHYTISLGGIAFAVGGSVLAALAGAIIPALGASRSDPLAAMTPLARPASLRKPMLLSIPGALLVLVDPAILFTDWRPIFRVFGAADLDQAARSFQFFAHFAVGLPLVMVGFFLLSPLFVVVVERIFGPVVSAIVGLRFALLRQQLSGGVWRAAGTASAMMVGLAVLVVLQVQGHTVIGGWRIPDKFPDMFIITPRFGGISPEQVEKIRAVENVKKDEVLPIAIALPELGSTIFSIRGASVLADATMFFGVEPALALKMMQLDFRDGTPEEAVRLMKANRRHVLVTEEFRKLKGLGVGDKLVLKTQRHGDVEYTIAGVVWSPGLDVIVSLFDLGKQFEQRTAASIFGTPEDARDDFGVENVYLFALNLEGPVQKEILAARVQAALGLMGVQAGDVRQVKYFIQHHFKKILLLISTVAFAAMAVAALGVANTITASVRSRRWQFGVMRSVGVTRSQLLRLVLAETILLALVGVALGLAAGGALAIDAKQLLLVMTGFDPPITVPWAMIGWGVLIVMTLALLAGIWPAVSVARAEPLGLLQAGRATA